MVANIVAVKPVALNGWILPAGTIAYPFTFLVTDVISELYGRRIATRVVWYGFGLSAAMVVMVYVAQALPSADFWEDQGAFETILGSVPRIVLGSMIAYLVSQHSDVLIFITCVASRTVVTFGSGTMPQLWYPKRSIRRSSSR